MYQPRASEAFAGGKELACNRGSRSRYHIHTTTASTLTCTREHTNPHRFHKDVEGGEWKRGLLPSALRGEEWEMCERRGADWPRRHRLGLECDAVVYIYSQVC